MRIVSETIPKFLTFPISDFIIITVNLMYSKDKKLKWADQMVLNIPILLSPKLILNIPETIVVSPVEVVAVPEQHLIQQFAVMFLLLMQFELQQNVVMFPPQLP